MWCWAVHPERDHEPSALRQTQPNRLQLLLKRKAEVTGGCASVPPAAAFPCIGTKSPESPGQPRDGGIVTQNPSLPSQAARPAPGRCCWCWTPSCAPSKPQHTGCFVLVAPGRCRRTVPIIPLPPMLPQEGF